MKTEITRKEIADILKVKFSIRRVSFSGFGYGDAYNIEFKGLVGRNSYEKLREIKINHTFNGEKIIG